MWITNGGFADVFIVFAKVDGERLHRFIVERAFPGVSTGKEEHKLGLLGSSTTPLILQDARVPAANLLGEIGKGHKIAFNTLNYGRLKLGAMCSGGARLRIDEAARYAGQRHQFGKPIASFGAIKQKLGDMIARQYAVEAMLYRTAGLIDERLAGAATPAADLLAALEEFAIEVVDPQGREQRDARLRARRERADPRRQRIRPRLSGRAPLSRRARQPHLRGHERDQPPADSRHAGAARAQGRPAAHPGGEGADGRAHGAAVTRPRRRMAPLDAERRAVTAMKKVALMVLGTAMQTYGEKLADEQEVLMAAADIIIDAYASESAVAARATGGEPSAARRDGASSHAAAARVFVNDAAGRVEQSARTALAGMADGDTLRTLLAALRRLVKFTPVNTIALRRQLADEAVSERAIPSERQPTAPRAEPRAVERHPSASAGPRIISIFPQA